MAPERRGRRYKGEEWTGEGGKGTSKGKYFPSPPPIFFFLIEANSANQNAE